MLTLTAALERVLAADPGAQCSITAPVEGLPVGHVLAVSVLHKRAAGVTAGSALDERYRIRRTMRNWSLVRDDQEIARAHPWDNSVNEAVLAGATAGMGSAAAQPNAQLDSLRALARDIREIGDRAVRGGHEPEGLVLLRLAVVLMARVGDHDPDLVARLADLQSRVLRPPES
tara:strand:- start:3193 stop:3711 length:519 start_codon:yes stop_codon:yes gene_type:complete